MAEDLKKYIQLCEDASHLKGDRGEGDMGSSIYGGSSKPKEEKVEEESEEPEYGAKGPSKALPSKSTNRSGYITTPNKRKYTVASNPGVKDENANLVRQLAVKFFHTTPYSTARIGTDKGTRRWSFHISLGGRHFDRMGRGDAKSTSEFNDKEKQLMRDFRDKFIALCEKNGVPKGSVDVKYHIGSGLYVSVQCKLGRKKDEEINESYKPKIWTDAKELIKLVHSMGYDEVGEEHCVDYARAIGANPDALWDAVQQLENRKVNEDYKPVPKVYVIRAGRLNTKKPEANEIIGSWIGDDPTEIGYLRCESSSGKVIVVAGWKSYDSYHDGELLDIHDDGNRTTPFGYQTGKYFRVVSIARNIDEIKMWPPTITTLYSMK